MQVLPGTLELLVLKALIWEPRHGYGIMDWIQESSGGLDLEEGALYPALHRMEERGWLDSEWGRSESNRRAKFYRLTAPGRRQLGAKTSEWNRHVEAIARVLGATRPQEGAP